ncbi:MAG: hypothetical protein KDE27_27210 [Planctomycetes bacterium]|nr:hypothetical protein [Planctomycetota bacterium]
MRVPRRAVLAAALAAAVFTPSATAQLARLYVGASPTNLLADFSQVFWASGSTPGTFFFLAPFGTTSAKRFEFGMFEWTSDAMMNAWYPAGWRTARFTFTQWTYLPGAPCASMPNATLPVVHGGIDSTYDYGPPLYTGPIVGLNMPLPGWVLGNASVPYVDGNSSAAYPERFALFLEDYFGNSLTACVGSTPVDWVAVEVQLSVL